MPEFCEQIFLEFNSEITLIFYNSLFKKVYIYIYISLLCNLKSLDSEKKK